MALLLCLIPALSFGGGDPPAPNPAREAADAVGQVLKHYGSPEGLNQGISVPMASGGTLKTMDGAKQVEGGLECPVSEKFITISARKDGFGRLVGVSVSQDLDLDGIAETSYTIPDKVALSGICRNGVFSCNRGGIDNCHYYSWQADSQGGIFLSDLGKEMEPARSRGNGYEGLGDCYCIANDCSRNFSAIYIESVMRDIGLGITEAIARQKPRYVITERKFDKSDLQDIELVYRVKDIAMCKAAQSAAPQGSAPAGEIPGSYGALQNMAQQETLRQSQDPGSYYNLVNSVPAAGNLVGAHKCTISRKFVVAVTENCPAGEQREGDFCYLTDVSAYLALQKTGGANRGCHFQHNHWSINTDKNGMQMSVGNHLCGDPNPGVGKAVRVKYECGGQTQYAHGREWQSLRIDCPSGDFKFVDGYYYTSSTGEVSCPEGYEAIELRCRQPVPQQETPGEEYIADECKVLNESPNCRLRAEVVDGVQTVKDYVPRPLPRSSCQQIAREKICRNWWEKSREYECTGSVDFDEDLKRIGKTTQSVELKGDAFTYTEHLKDAQGRETTGNVISKINPLDSYDSCEQSCKTRVPIVDTTVSSETTRSGGRTSTDSWETKYYKCEGGKCPAPSGEQLLEDCKCINDFAEAISKMSVIDEILQDADCSGKWKKDGSCQGKVIFFKGSRSECLGGGIEALINCCDKKSGRNIVEITCKEEDVKTLESKRNGLCHFVGDYCANEWWHICTRKKETYCCFGSLLARIIVEQGRPQLKAFGANSWGTAENPDCRGLTPEEFQQLDFSRIDLSEFTRDIKVKMPSQASEEQMKKQLKIPGQ